MKIIVYTRPNCTECERVKSLLEEKKMGYDSIDMTELSEPEQFELKTIARKNRQISMPLLFVNESFVGTSEFETKYL